MKKFTGGAKDQLWLQGPKQPNPKPQARRPGSVFIVETLFVNDDAMPDDRTPVSISKRTKKRASLKMPSRTTRSRAKQVPEHQVESDYDGGHQVDTGSRAVKKGPSSTRVSTRCTKSAAPTAALPQAAGDTSAPPTRSTRRVKIALTDVPQQSKTVNRVEEADGDKPTAASTTSSRIRASRKVQNTDDVVPVAVRRGRSKVAVPVVEQEPVGLKNKARKEVNADEPKPKRGSKPVSTRRPAVSSPISVDEPKPKRSRKALVPTESEVPVSADQPKPKRGRKPAAAKKQPELSAVSPVARRTRSRK